MVRRDIIGIAGIFCILLIVYVPFLASTAKATTGKSSASFDHIPEIESNPVIYCGGPLDWDQHIREIGNILYEPEDTGYEYKIFYSGYQGDYQEDKVYIGYAFSSDGKSWTKYGKIINHPAEDPYVIKVDDIYYLYAEDKADTPFRNIRRWHGSDGKTWIDDGIVLRPQWWSWWESQDVSSPVIWREAQTWYMLYEGRGKNNMFTYFIRFWYYLCEGTFANTLGKIGLATSENGIDWVRYKSNPIFTGSGIEGDFDQEQVVADDIVKIDQTYYLSYHAWNGSAWASGIAKSRNRISWLRADTALSSSPTIMIYFDGKDYIIYYYLDDSSGIYRSNLQRDKADVPINWGSADSR